MTTKNIDKTQILNIVFDFFKTLEGLCNQKEKTPRLEELEKYLSKDLQMTSNGHLIVKSSANYLERVHKFRKKYSKVQISKPLEEPLIFDNKAVFYYHIDLTTHTGQQKRVYLMGLVTIENGKMSRWTQVTNEEGVGNWDA